jgi:hypothetical protein
MRRQGRLILVHGRTAIESWLFDRIQRDVDRSLPVGPYDLLELEDNA